MMKRSTAGSAATRKRQRPYHFLQEVGLECALWPHLYWCTEMTETHEQWSDARREERRDAKEAKKRKAKAGKASPAPASGHLGSDATLQTESLSPLGATKPREQPSRVQGSEA